MEEWNLKNWKIYYWANSDDMGEYLNTGNHLAINIDATSGKPIKKPFKKCVSVWIDKFGDGYDKNNNR